LRRALIGSCWILFGEYVMFNDEARKTFNPTHVYPGVAFFLQNLFIFLSSLVFKVISKSGSGSGIKNLDHISESLKNNFLG
jgi:hypothetical protein